MNEIQPITANPVEGNNVGTGRSTKQLIILLAATLIVLGAVSIFAWYFGGAKGSANSGMRPSYNEILEANSAFSNAEQLRLSGEHSSAIGEYEKALQNVDGVYEEGVIKLRLAISKTRGNQEEQIEAIRLFKEIAAHEGYSLNVRAYAVHNMSEFLSTHAFDPMFANEIFKDAPYSEMLSPNKTITYRKLAEHASSLYPIAEAEFQVAQWYANEVLRMVLSQKPNTERIASYIGIVKSRIESGDKDLIRIGSQHSNYDATIPYVLLQRAKVLGAMEVAGESVGDANEAFLRAIWSYTTYLSPGRDGFARFYYAAYLFGKKGEDMSERVTKTLAPLYTDAAYDDRPFEDFLANARTNLVTTKKLIVSLAVTDPNFKDYLKTLGWTDADF